MRSQTLTGVDNGGMAVAARTGVTITKAILLTTQEGLASGAEALTPGCGLCVMQAPTGVHRTHKPGEGKEGGG